MDVRLPDGTIIANVPEGTTKADLVAKLQRNGMAVPAEWLAASAPAAPQDVAQPKPAGRTLADLIGLTARAGLKGAMALPALGADALGGIANTVQNVIAGKPGAGYQFKPTGGAIDDLLDRAGLPKPQTDLEKVASTGAELMSGAGTAAKVADIAAKGITVAGRTLGPLASSGARDVAARLAADPTQQIVSAGAAGVAGQQAKISGASGLGEFISAAGGGVLGAGALGAGRAAANGIKSLIPKNQQIQLSRVDQTINVSLQSAGIDPATITPAMRTALRQQVGKAMQLGDLDQGAVARLADYTRLNMTPTRGRLTLDPYDVTQEMNASKVAAALGAKDAKLPAIAQQNNTRMLSTVDGFNPIADSFTTGQRAMAPIQSLDRALEASKKSAYDAAEQLAGGDIPLSRAPVMDSIYARLNKGNLIRHVPANVQAMLDDIAAGVIRRGDQQFEVPFDVKAIDSLKSLIATEQRGAQGSAKMALSEIRKALDETPLEPIKRQFGGNQLVTEQGAKFLQQQDAQAGNVKAALDDARAKNFSWMRWRESAPAIEAAVNDANPETFVRNFIRNQNADARDVRRAAEVINRSPDARDAVRSELVQYLKNAAIGKGNESQTGNFSGRQWLSALDGINVRKLALFFEPEEIETLRALGRVGTYETFQPRGSAVNNSNTAAGVAGLLQGITKYAQPLASKIPLGQEIISNPLQNITLSVMERGASNVPKSLLLQQQAERGLLDPLLLPAFVSGGLLSAQ